MHLTQPPISKSKSLLLKNIQYNNSGEYYCFGSYGDQDTNFVARGVINVFGENWNCFFGEFILKPYDFLKFQFKFSL